MLRSGIFASKGNRALLRAATEVTSINNDTTMA